jgi:predicted dehydrogenase
MRYRAAVVGCGRIGLLMEEDPRQARPATHAGAFAMNPRTELAGLVDIDEAQRQRAAEMYPGVACFADYREMLDAVRPDIVAVAPPPDGHRSVVEAAAKAGVRTIICEKPIAPTLEDATSMIAACREADAMLFVNHARRFDPLIRTARDEVVRGAIGEVLQAACLYTAGLMNTGTHLLDLLRFFLGDATAVYGIANGRGHVPAGDMGVDGLVEFGGGARAAIQHVDSRDYSVFDVTLVGRRGVLALTRFGFRIDRIGVTARADVSGLSELDLAGRWSEGEPRSFMSAMVDHVVACCDGKDAPVSRGEDGRAALALVLALRESAERGGARVEIETQRRRVL